MADVVPVAEELNATLVDMRFIKPLDEELIASLAESHDLLVSVEDNAIKGGAGSGINEFMESKNLQTAILNLGLPDKFLDHGKVSEMRAEIGLDSKGILNAIRQRLK